MITIKNIDEKFKQKDFPELYEKFKQLNPTDTEEPLLWAVELLKNDDQQMRDAVLIKLTADVGLLNPGIKGGWPLHSRITNEAVYDYYFDETNGKQYIIALIQAKFK